MKIVFKILVFVTFIVTPISVYSAQNPSYSMMWWFPNSEFATLTPSKELLWHVGNSNPDTWLIEKLNPTTGIFNTVSILKGCWKYAYAPQFDLTNMLMLATEKYSPTIDVISLTTGKVAGTFTVDVSPGTDMDVFQPNLAVSPDGSRIVICWEDGEDYDNVCEIFNGNTFKSIIKITGIGDQWNNQSISFSRDSKFIYAASGLTVDTIDPSTGNIIKSVLPNVINKPGSIFLFHSHAIYSLKDNVAYVYNIRTGGLSPSIPTNTYYGNFNLSPDNDYLTVDGQSFTNGTFVSLGQVNVYNTTTGNKVAGLTITQNTGKGAIVSWPDDHTFIYNTTQQLIYFDIKQNKIIKQIPIIRPWEQKGWMPEVK